MPFMCAVFEKVFHARATLSEHLRTHSNDRPFTCLEPGCGKSFKSQSAVNRHLKSSLHNDVKTIQCGECGREFDTPAHLEVHIRTHTDEKPFSCLQCQKSFAKKCNLTTHMKIQSTEELKCQVCGTAYKKKTYFLKQVKKHETVNHN